MNDKFSSVCPMIVVGFFFLLGGCISSPSISGIITASFGGLYLSYFLGARLAMLDYRGKKSRIGFRITRYILGLLLLVGLVGVIYSYAVYQISTFELSKRIYNIMIDLWLLMYVVFFRPSDATVGRKVLKVVGFCLIILATLFLGQVHKEYLNYTFMGPQVELVTSYGVVLTSIIFFIIGLICIASGYKKRKNIVEETPDLQME